MATVAEESRLPPGAPDRLAEQSLRSPPPPRRSRGPVPGAGWYREAAEDVLHVARIQPGSADFHPHLIGGGKRVGHVHQLEGGEVAGTVELQCFHRGSVSSRRSVQPLLQQVAAKGKSCSPSCMPSRPTKAMVGAPASGSRGRRRARRPAGRCRGRSGSSWRLTGTVNDGTSLVGRKHLSANHYRMPVKAGTAGDARPCTRWERRPARGGTCR